jgi:hypothetical protein
MSILSPQELFRKISADSRETSKLSPKERAPGERFRELLQAPPADEKPREKDFFSLIEEEEEDKKIIDGPISTQIVPSCSVPLPMEQNKENTERVEAPYSIPFALSSIKPSLYSSIPIRNILPAEIEAIFEKMASCMLVMSSSGEAETTLFLDNPHFASSIFFGTKITIREFSTAPKAFNVEIASSSQAIIAIEASKSGLLSAFQNGNFNFSIHRFDTHIQNEERPVLHRKESEDRDNQERRGGREQ